MASAFEEKYLHLRDENLDLKKKKNEHEATIKRMYTKMAIIEEALKKKKHSEDAENQDDSEPTKGNGGSAIPHKRDLDTEKFVQALKTENAQLRKKNQALMEKNRQLEEKMRQHQLKYHGTTKMTSASATNASLGASSSSVSMGKRTPAAAAKVHNVARKQSMDGEPLARQVDQARRLHREHLTGDLEMALKNRLVMAEKQLVKLQHENEQLRLQGKRGLVPRRASANHHSHNNNNDTNGSSDSELDDDQATQLKRELRDRQAQLAILNARYENLEANAAAEREIQEKTIDQLEHMNRQVHKLRTQLQDSSLDKEEMEIKLAKAADLQQEVAMLRDQNRKLEDRMTVMCESPFINDAFQRKERIDKLFDLEKLMQQQKATIAAMTDENQRLQATIKELQVNIKLMKQAKDLVEQDVDKLHQQLVAERNSRPLPITMTMPATTSARPPSPQQPRPVPAFTSIHPDRRDAASSPLKSEQPATNFASAQASTATPIVTRRYFDMTMGDPMAVHAATCEDEANARHLKNRIHVLQLAHLKAVHELERCEKMLHAQTNINRELAQEIEELTTKNVSGSAALQKRVKQLELALDERQHRIQTLEAQIRQLKFAREKLLRAQENDKQLNDLMDSSDDDEDAISDVASVSESLVMAARDLSPGEQLLEIWILGATFDRTVVTTNASTFMLCDFYDFESQSTPLLVGHRPEYNFSSTFKVTVDAFFLRYLASETLVFELYQAVQGDFRLLGRASVALSTLLRAKGAIKEPALPVKLAYGADHDTVIGTVNVVLRLATPISEIWKLHLQSYPQDVQLLRSHRLTDTADDALLLDDDGDEDNQVRAVNELQITVLACRGLRSYLKKKPQSSHALSTTPSPYVHYQILGFPDVFTNIVPSSTSPEFDLHTSKQFFSVQVDSCLLHFFSKFQLWFTVFDDQADLENSSNNANDGAIGRCGLLLDELAKGECVRGWFPLTDHNDQPAGEISILIEWKDAFQIAQLYSSRRIGSSKRQADLHSLDYDQQHAVMRLFAPDMDGRVNYRQFLTYAFPSEGLELVTSKIKERLEYAIDTEQLASVEDIFVSDRATKPTTLQEISMTEMLKRIERFGVFLKDGEVDLLVQIFGKRVTSKAASQLEPTTILVHYLSLHINPRMTCAERLLLHKIRHTLRLFVKGEKGTRPSPSQPFERFDPSTNGFVSRAEFKRCLGVLGFELVDITKAYKELVRSATATEGHNDSPSSNQAEGEVDLDEPTLQASTQSSEKPVKNTAQPTALPVSKPLQPSTKTVIDPRTEFDRRKELFQERMKAIASTSAKSLVYEQIAKQKQDHHAVKASDALAQRVQQKLTQLHVPKALHHDAARILQTQFRQYRLRRAMADSAPSTNVHVPQGSIVDIDLQLSRMLKTWTRDELESLETSIFDTIASELPDAKQAGTLSRKQLSFVLSKIPRIALEPTLLQRLCEYFAVPSRDQSGLVAYRPLVHFICSVATEPKQRERPVLPVLSALARTHIDAAHALQTFMTVGDVNSSGTSSIKRFREALRRLGLQLAPKDLRVLLVMLSDPRAIDVLYLPLVKLLRDSPTAEKTRTVITRCGRFGVTKLRDALLTRVSPENNGSITREQLHSVLMQFNIESVRFEPGDAAALIDIVRGNRSAGATSVEAAQISIDELVLTLERLVSALENPLGDDTLNRYSGDQLQRLAQSSRTLLCGPYADILSEFERFDWKESGLVSLAEFVSIVPRVGFSLFTPGQVNALAKQFGAKLKGSFGINYRQFLDWTTPPVAPLEIEAIETKLRRVATQTATQGNQITQVLVQWREAFAAVDRLSEGSLTRGQFATVCLETLRLPLSTEELRVVLMSYDRGIDDCVDFNAFVQLDWSKTSQRQRQVQFEAASSRPIGEVLGAVRRALLANKVTTDAVLRTVSGGDNGRAMVTVTQFIVSMKQLGAVVSPAEAELIFQAHTDRSERLDLLNFVGRTLGIKAHTGVKKTERASRLTTDDEERLRTAVTSALKYSRKEFTQVLEHFDEFCVVYDHRDISARKLWKTMEKNGLVGLLSKKGAGLLIHKFTVDREDSEDEEQKTESDGERPTLVSLRQLSKYLHQLAGEASPRRPPRDSAEPTTFDGAMTAVRKLLTTCESGGVDVRGAFEQADTRYAGLLPALDFKRTLLDLGFNKSVEAGASPEALIGLLVRQFRIRDGISYTTMLARVSTSAELEPMMMFCESVRTRVRLRAGFQGLIRLDGSIKDVCRPLDAAFSHFDREKKGFLTASEVTVGLQALKYNVSNEHLDFFMRTAGVFRHSNASSGLSRMEFDAFALDPMASRLLDRLAGLLYQPSDDDASVPRVAQLSRLFIGQDHPQLSGVLPMSVAWGAIEQVTRSVLHRRDRLRLQILFDVNRDDHFAYRLFMKVSSQCHALLNGRAVDTTTHHSPAASSTEFQCSSADVVKALYNQLSSVDFASQIDVLEEHLRRAQPSTSDGISREGFERTLELISLKLTAEAITSLQQTYISARSGFINHRPLIEAIKRLHDDEDQRD